MIKKLVAGTALMVALTLGVSACSTSNVSESKFQSELQSKLKVTHDQAVCITKDVFNGDMSQKDINKLYTAATDKDLPAGVGDQFNTIVTKCVKK